MNVNIPVINGESYSWANIVLNLFGRSIEGVSAISYKRKQDKQNNYGRGNKPVSRGRGKVEFEASITLENKEVEAILALLPPGKSLLDIKPFPIVVSFSGDGVALRTHTLQYCEFTEDGIDSKTGDTMIDRVLPLIVGDIVGL